MTRLLVIALTLFATLTVAGEKPRPQTPVAETFQEVMRLRMDVNEFFAAPTTDAARQLRSRWQDLPADVRRRIESRHPGTEWRLLHLESEIEDTPPAAKPATNTVVQPAAPATPDIWGQSRPAADPAPVPNPRRLTPPVQFSDELDVLGNRPPRRR